MNDLEKEVRNHLNSSVTKAALLETILREAKVLPELDYLNDLYHWIKEEEV